MGNPVSVTVAQYWEPGMNGEANVSIDWSNIGNQGLMDSPMSVMTSPILGIRDELKTQCW